MGGVEIWLNEEGALKVVHNYKLRLPSSWRWSNGQQRHPVVRWPNCSSFWSNWQDASSDLTRFQVVFIIILIFCVIRICHELAVTQALGRPPVRRNGVPSYAWGRRWTFGDWKGIVFLAVFTAVFAIRVLVKMMRRMAAPSPQMKVEVKTVSGLMEQV